ncbi:cellulose synthase subunit BcsC-related outer membrane protein [Gluconacetobacter takamatsuzukensis]|uniref:Tetratricopeptide repeat protein n=1 Tax=Gluconacetobacter takamatsuzukensis TaxID=1286190 RepID=A0A7W4PRJ4_9PROT|nr:cellulose synthase subunit BcsC-related outer membrane protein [Gluconacetobacter takamatsuzukensis]MBB2205539.1 tetratricopeptide repeat protein [Gluconacetobacter takamatsuzukensis]
MRLLVLAGGPLLAVQAQVPAQAQAQSPQQAPGAGAGVVPILIQRAQYWYDHGWYDQAQQALAQARQLAPRDPKVIALSGQWALHMGDTGSARQAAMTLHEMAPTAPETVRLEESLRVQGTSQKALDAVRALVRDGHTAAAASGYRQLFPSGPPPQYALEYYQTLAGAVGYRDQGQEGLRNLVAADPNNVPAQIAYAQVLTWRESTRAGGLSRLRRLDGIPGLSAENRAALRQDWRTALAWLPPTPDSVPYFDEWLAQNPDDTEVRGLRAKAEAARTDPAVLERTQGYHDLEAGSLSTADRHFSNALATAPNDSDALGGLGLVRMRQGRMDEAHDLLQHAIQANPADAARWRDAMNGAQVAVAYGQVRSLMEQGHYDAAQTQLDSMLARDPTQTGLLSLEAEIFRRRGNLPRAEALYRQVLQGQPDNVGAVQGLYQILRSSGRTAEAESLAPRLRRLSPTFEQQMAGADLLARADRTVNLDDRIGLLRQAMDAQPRDPWLRLHLAQALLQAGSQADARDVMSPLLASDRRASAAELQAGIFFANQNGDFATVRQLLDRLPPGARTPDIRRIAEDVEYQQQIADAPVDLPEARLYFLQMARRGHDPDGARGRMIAEALLKRNDRAGAVQILQVFFDASAPPTARQRLAYAGLALRMQDRQFARRMLDGITTTGLAPDDLAAMREIQTGMAVMAADQLNEQGRQADAYDALQPALSASQPSPAARLALARLYQSANQPATALSVARAVVDRNPDDLDARLAVVRLALQLDDMDEATDQLRAMTAQAPADPRIWLASAAIHHAGGNWTASLGDLARARDLRHQQLGGQQPGSAQMMDDGGVLAGNPFRDRASATAAVDPRDSQDPILRSIDSEVASTTQAYAPFVDVGPVFRGRSGTGLNQLTEGDLPIAGAFTLGGGRLTASITPTALSSGSGNMNYLEGLREVGTAALTGDYGAALGRFHAVGVGTDLAYARDWLRVDIGSSPLGFRTTNLLGEIEVSPQITSQMRIRLTAERRAVNDSVVAYSGLRDPLTGVTWGGVTRNRATGQLEYGDALMNFYARGGFAYLQGHDTPDNIEYEAGAGGSVSVYKDTLQEVHLGVDMTWFRYNNNQYAFTLGNGGYFSPQTFFSLLVPVRYAGHSGKWVWKAGASLGYQSYRSRSALFYPTSNLLQAVLDARDPTGALVPGVSSSGLVGGANASVSYQVSPALRVAGDFLYQKAGPWNETTAGVSVHYSFMGPP